MLSGSLCVAGHQLAEIGEWASKIIDCSAACDLSCDRGQDVARRKSRLLERNIRKLHENFRIIIAKKAQNSVIRSDEDMLLQLYPDIALRHRSHSVDAYQMNCPRGEFSESSPQYKSGMF